MDKKIIVKFSWGSPDFPLERQTPGSTGIWKNCQFIINDDIDECDFWVVYNRLLHKETVRCAKENCTFISTEPPSLATYNKQFLKQFNHIITCHQNIKGDNVLYTQQGLPWHVGRHQKEHVSISFSKSYDELKALTDVTKSKMLSIITSDKMYSKGHKERYDFAMKIKEHYKNNVDLFGRGVNEITDKWEAIAPYKYHIAIENSMHEDYWTEKMSDTYLGLSYPIYYGCPNLTDYFSEDAFTRIDINDIDGAIRIIDSITVQDRHKQSLHALQNAKRLVLDEYNIFAMLHKFCNKHYDTKKRQTVTIVPEQQGIVKRLRTKAYHFLFRSTK